MVCQLLFGKSLGLLDTPGVEADHYHPLMRSVDKFTGITWLSMSHIYFPSFLSLSDRSIIS
jgi:hypothetical protein